MEKGTILGIEFFYSILDPLPSTLCFFFNLSFSLFHKHTTLYILLIILDFLRWHKGKQLLMLHFDFQKVGWVGRENGVDPAMIIAVSL